jgi:hypothetical protein
MHAAIIKVTINDFESAVGVLRDEIVPQVAQAPGFVAGYWMRKDDSGMAVVVCESEEAARAVGEQARSRATGVTVEDVEVRGVVAHA